MVLNGARSIQRKPIQPSLTATPNPFSIDSGTHSEVNTSSKPISTGTKSGFHQLSLPSTSGVSHQQVTAGTSPYLPTSSILPSELPSVSSEYTSWEEILIQSVQDREALYNFGLPVRQRTTAKKNQLWTEIATITGVGVDDLKAKWKYLRDCYIKAKKKVHKYVPSGSEARVPVDPGFRFFNQMKFLDDTVERQATVSSLTMTVKPPLSSPSHSISSDSGLASPQELLSPTQKKRKIDEKELQKGILEALSAPDEKLDGVDGFLIRLGESLRKMPYRERVKLEMKIMQLVFEIEEVLVD